jgi:uncharacterized protein (DUF2141 family)
MTKIILRYVFACLAIIPYVAYADTLQVTVNGVKAGEGNLRLAVFDEAHRDEFPEGEYLLGVTVPATGDEMTVEISIVESGEYAIAVIQDLNENEKLDKNMLGIPKEPYGFSGKWEKGESSYDKASFNTDDVGFAVTISLK